jgi:uncharacterized membrane protein YobD (UPF0266 family)
MNGPLLFALYHILTNLSALCHNRYRMDHYMFQGRIITCVYGPFHYWQTCQLHATNLQSVLWVLTIWGIVIKVSKLHIKQNVTDTNMDHNNVFNDLKLIIYSNSTISIIDKSVSFMPHFDRFVSFMPQTSSQCYWFFSFRYITIKRSN